MERADIGAENAIFCFGDSFYSRLRTAMAKKNPKKAPDCSGSLKGFVAGGVAVYQSHIGAPAAAMLFDILIASGVKRLLMLGMAGSISADCHIGDVVVPLWGVREEGTSHHYVRSDEQARASPSMVKGIRKHFGHLGIREGGVWTIDAPYRETAEKVKCYSTNGVLVVEMECTALMAVAQCRRKSFGSVLVVTDEVRHDGWEEAFRGAKVRRTTRLVCESAADYFS
jgi:uridine phosphorylase